MLAWQDPNGVPSFEVLDANAASLPQQVMVVAQGLKCDWGEYNILNQSSANPTLETTSKPMC